MFILTLPEEQILLVTCRKSALIQVRNETVQTSNLVTGRGKQLSTAAFEPLSERTDQNNLNPPIAALARTLYQQWRLRMTSYMLS